MTSPRAVIARRRALRSALLDRARQFAAALDPSLDVQAVVVFGSVARGDFHDASDIDVLVIAARLPERPLDRLAAVGLPPTGVQPVVWSPRDWAAELARGNPVAVEALDHGVWLRGGPPAG